MPKTTLLTEDASMASRGAVLRGAQSIPGGARPTPAPQGSSAGYNNGRGLNAPSIGQVSPLAAQLANEGGYARSYGPFLPRPTDAFTAGAFGPFSPILPVPVDSPPPGLDRPEARRWQFPVGWNLPTGQPGDEGLKLASFEQLRRLADVYSVARAAIEFRKNQVRGIEWDIIPTPDAAKAYQNQPAKMAEFGKRQAKAKKFFSQPDKDYLSYSTWIGAVLEDVFVYDALSLLIRPTRMRGKGVLGGNMDSLMTVTGSTIRPLVDLHGGTPRPPAPAFQQYLYGVPRSDYMTMITGDDLDSAGLIGTQVAQFRGDQMIYAPMVPRDWTPYGFGPIERALIPIRTGIAKQAYQYDWFEESTVPAAYIIPGDTAMTPNQLRELQDALNAIAGDPAWKQKLIVLPPGSHVEPQRPTVAADQLDELVMTQVCMSFAVSPMELGISPRASTTTSPGAANQMAKAAQNSSQDSGLTPILKFLQDIFNSILVNVCNQTDMQFTFEGLQQEEDMDALTGVLVQQFQNGMRTLDECRQELNLQPYGLEESSEPLIVTPTGPTPLSTAVANAQNAAAQSAAQAQQTQAQAGQITAQTAHTQVQAANTQANTEATQSRTQMAQESHEVNMNTPPEPSAAAGAEGKAEMAAAGGSKPTPGHSAAVAANNAAASRKKSEDTDDVIAKVIVTDPLAEKRAAAELEALTRHLVKGRHVSTWEPRYLTHGILADIAKSMADGLGPREAASRVSVKNVVLPRTSYEWQEDDGCGLFRGPARNSNDGAGEAGGAPFQGVEAADLVKVGPKGYIHGWVKVGAGNVDHLPVAKFDPDISKAYASWNMEDACERTRIKADAIAGLPHLANPKYPNEKATGADTKRAKLMLSKLADDATGQQRIGSLSPQAAGRWSGWISKTDGSPAEPGRILRRETMDDAQFKAFTSELGNGGKVNFSLAAFTFLHPDVMREWGFGGTKPHEILINVDGNPRVIQAGLGEVITGGEFSVTSHGPAGDHYEVNLKQEGVYGADGKLVPVDG